MRRLRARCARQSCSSQALLTSLAWRRWSGSVTGELQAHGGLLQFRDASTGDNAVLDTIQIRSSTARRAMLGGLFTCATAYASATLAHEQCQDLTFVALPARSASVPIGAYNSFQPGQRAASGFGTSRCALSCAGSRDAQAAAVVWGRWNALSHR